METIGSTSRSKTPWHPGETAIQQRAGVAERMAEVGQRVIRDHLIDQHRQFYPLLPFVVLGSVDPEGNAWATLRAGKPGFLQAPSATRLRVHALRDRDDPAERGMNHGDAIGLLGIDLQTRRRNRLNGIIDRDSDDRFDIGVVQSYGNCPQYIQLRAPEFTRDPGDASRTTPIRMAALDARSRAIIEQADTFFVASYFDAEDGTRQADVSHRGGKSGFVRLGDDGVLTIPDFAGNLFFNTLGNLLINHRAGLVFVDFATGDLLQLSGRAEVLTDAPEIETFQGAERLWRFTPQQIVYRANALPLRMRFENQGWSPNSLMTGSWQESASRAQALELSKAWRPFRVEKLVDESSLVRSITIVPTDGAGLVPHRAGQHLPLRMVLPGYDAPQFRSYTLSVAPSDGVYRISVKKQGLASRQLHELAIGDVIHGRAPAGDFTIDARELKPAVLMAAGIGVTPMIAMLRHIVFEGLRLRHTRPTWLFYAARTRGERAFDAEIDTLVRRAQGLVRCVRVLSNTVDAVAGRDYEFEGRLDSDVLRAVLPFDDYEFFICGPPGFMQDSYDSLRALNIADNRIKAESFGPATIQRRIPSGPEELAGPKPATAPVPVAFLDSAKEARWTPEQGSLLELAESRGLSPPFSCRAGYCGSCRTRVVEGTVAYLRKPAFKVAADEALICCAVPAADPGSKETRLHLAL